MMKLYNALNSAIKRAFNALFFSCHDMTHSDESQAKLSQRTAFRLRRFLHLCLCRFCRAYHRQARQIDRQTDSFRKEFPEDTSVQLSDNARDKIRERLRALKKDQ